MSTAGALDRRVTLQRATVSANAFNEPIETWGTLAVVSGGKRDASANEAYRAQEVGAQISTRFRLRHAPAIADLNPADRLIYAGRTYNITAVREVERNRWLEVDAVQRPDIASVETSP